MRTIKWVVAAAGMAALLAGCMDNRYPSQGAYSSQAPNRGGYWASPNRDADHDGVPNRYDRDANGDGVPDRYQGRPAPSRY